MNYYTTFKKRMAKQLVQKLQQKLTAPPCFVVCLAPAPNLLTILASKAYINYAQRGLAQPIVGVIRDRAEANALVLAILTEHYQTHQNFTDFHHQLLTKVTGKTRENP